MHPLRPTLATLLLLASAATAAASPVATTHTYADRGVSVAGPAVDAPSGPERTLRTAADLQIAPRDSLLPTLIASFSTTWTQGTMTLGAAWAGRFFGAAAPADAPTRGAEPVPQGDGRYGWSLYDAGPELKLAWTLGRFRPYVGAGFDLVYGRLDHVGSSQGPGADGPRGQGRPVADGMPLEGERTARFLVRPHAGVDIAFGRACLGLQADYAMVSTGDAPRLPRETGPGLLMVTGVFRGTF